MPKLRALQLLNYADEHQAVEATASAVASPWAERSLSRPIIKAIFGGKDVALSREDAMSIPPVVKGRSIIVGKLAGNPLRALGPDGVDVSSKYPWLYRTTGSLSPWHRMVWTLDDLIFHGWSLWLLARDDAGVIEEAVRWAPADWHFDADGAVMVRLVAGQEFVEVDADQVCLIPGPAEGLLEFADRSLRTALAIEESIRKRAKNPIPVIEIHATDPNDELTEGEQIELIERWATARDSEHGEIEYTPARVEVRVHGDKFPALGIEARNFSKVDVANFLGLPASALDGSLSTASLTYSTTEGNRDEMLAAVSEYWGAPIVHRLSLDDMVEPTHRVRFDFTDPYATQPSPTGPVTKD
jgi:hypothetical protein